jgi:hypothetical protein
MTAVDPTAGCSKSQLSHCYRDKARSQITVTRVEARNQRRRAGQAHWFSMCLHILVQSRHRGVTMAFLDMLNRFSVHGAHENVLSNSGARCTPLNVELRLSARRPTSSEDGNKLIPTATIQTSTTYSLVPLSNAIPDQTKVRLGIESTSYAIASTNFNKTTAGVPDWQHHHCSISRLEIELQN